MTFCKVLKESRGSKYTVTAYEEIEKFETVPHYSVVVSEDCFGFIVCKTAKTTWRKKFKELEREWSR